MIEKLKNINNDIVHGLIVYDIYKELDPDTLYQLKSKTLNYFKSLDYSSTPTERVRIRRLIDFINNRIDSIKIDLETLN